MSLNQKDLLRETHHQLDVHAVSNHVVKHHETLSDASGVSVPARPVVSAALPIPLKHVLCIKILAASPLSPVSKTFCIVLRNLCFRYRGGIAGTIIVRIIARLNTRLVEILGDCSLIHFVDRQFSFEN